MGGGPVLDETGFLKKACRPASDYLQPWAPVVDNSIAALAADPDGSQVLLGGYSGNLNGVSQPGAGAVDAVNGTTNISWGANIGSEGTGGLPGTYRISRSLTGHSVTGHRMTTPPRSGGRERWRPCRNCSTGTGTAPCSTSRHWASSSGPPDSPTRVSVSSVTLIWIRHRHRAASDRDALHGGPQAYWPERIRSSACVVPVPAEFLATMSTR
jgi:hypothetical protein